MQYKRRNRKKKRKDFYVILNSLPIQDTREEEERRFGLTYSFEWRKSKYGSRQHKESFWDNIYENQPAVVVP